MLSALGLSFNVCYMNQSSMTLEGKVTRGSECVCVCVCVCVRRGGGRSPGSWIVEQSADISTVWHDAVEEVTRQCVWACPYLGFLEDVDGVHVVLDGVDDDEHVPELGGDDAAAVVARVLRPHDVHLVVSQVPQL